MSTGFSPFELLYRLHSQGALDLVQEEREEAPVGGVIPPSTYVTSLRERLRQVATIEAEGLCKAQAGQKTPYGARIWLQEFQIGKMVLLLLSTSANKLLVKC